MTTQAQFAVNDLNPFGPQMIGTCPLDYVNSGLGRQAPHFSPSNCDFGLLAALLGGANAQHVFIVGCFALSGVSMLLLLRRIGNPLSLSVVGAVAYELSPIMLSFQQSGEGLLLTEALLPAILLGAVPARGHPTIADGARSGALLAAVTYANAQAPTLAIFLLVPLIWVTLGRKFAGSHRAVRFCVGFVVIYVLASLPVFQILSGFGAAVQGARSVLESDFLARLAWSSPFDFFAPYLFVGALPVGLALIVLPGVSETRPAERAAVISLASVLALWELLRLLGPQIAPEFPLITLYKDFIKLEIVFAVPLVILSVAVLRWSTESRGVPAPLKYGLAAVLATLLVLPIAFGQQPKQIYTANPESSVGSESITSGQLGLPNWSAEPATYGDVLNSLERKDPSTGSYRVLWTPIDWRLFQLSRATSINLLLYYADGPPASRAVVSQTFNAIASGQRAKISALLSDEGVKYVIVDLADGEDRNTEPWERGPPASVQVAGTEMLAGAPAAYRAIFSGTPGLKVIQETGRWLTYINLNWRPILQSYSAILGVPTAKPGTQHQQSLTSVPLLWSGLPGVLWQERSDHSIQIVGFDSQRGPMSTPWAPVHAFMPVVAGVSYAFGGEMDYEQVTRAHAKVIWHGDVAPQDVTTFLINPLDGSGVASLNQTAVAPVGASSVEILLMGGWAQAPGGYTRYVGFQAGPVTSPDLTSIVGHPETIQSLGRELPGVLVESNPLPASAIAGVDTFALTETTGTALAANEIALVTASNLGLSGQWTVNAAPDGLGVEHFGDRSGGVLRLSRSILALAQPGSAVIWMETKPGASDLNDSTTWRVSVGSGPITIACHSANCTITNVLLIPPIPRALVISRYEYGYSSILRGPDGTAPIMYQGDWASLYPYPLSSYPSAAYSSSTLSRVIGLIFGHLVMLIGLFAGPIIGFAGVQLRVRRRSRHLNRLGLS